jgi:hypothetical protein
MTFLLGCLLSLTTAQVPPPVAGTVTDRAAQTPVAGARILLARNERPATDALVTSTDANGRFSFPVVPAGTYQLFAVHDAYIRGSHLGAIVVASGGSPVAIKMTLVPTGVLSGRVFGEFGGPAERVYVRALGPDGSTVATTQTNDLGEYRLFGLSPGTVVVCAQRYTAPRLDADAQVGGLSMGARYVVPTPPCADCPGEGQSMIQIVALTRTGAFIDPRALSRQTSVAVYYPSGSDRAAARPIEITPGAQIGGIDLQLVP